MEGNRLRTLEIALRVLAALFFVATLIYVLGGVLPSEGALFAYAPFAANSAVKVFLLGLCCLYAAGAVAHRIGLFWIVVAGHAVSMLAMAICWIALPADRPAMLGPLSLTIQEAFRGAMVLDGAILLLLLVLVWRARAEVRSSRAAEPATAWVPATPPERTLRAALHVVALAFAAGAVLHQIGALTSESFRELPLVTNSVVECSVFAMVALYAARGLSSRLHALDILVGGAVVSVLAAGVLWLVRPEPFPEALDLGRRLAASAGVGAVLSAGLLLLAGAAWRARYDLAFLRPLEFRALMAAAEAVLDDEQRKAVPASDVAKNVDRYLVRIRAHRRWLFRIALFVTELLPLSRLLPPLSAISTSGRRDMLKRTWKWTGVETIAKFKRGFVQARVRIVAQLVYLGYYNDARSHAAVGYRSFTQRLEDAGEPVPSKSPTSLRILETDADEITADVVVVGSGAAGAVIAHELARRGRDVLVLERGRYVPPAETTDDEVEMIGLLYADGVMQQTTDFRFIILQGSCVGGTTVVNNAVCFRPPDEVVASWNRDFDAGLDVARLRASVDHVWEWLKVQAQPVKALNPSGEPFRHALRATSGAVFAGGDAPPVDANIEGCLGCGYCNIGCAYGKKLSMLETVLPEAQRAFGDRVKILPDCEVERLRTRTGSPSHVHDLWARRADGRRIVVRAKTYVVASGAIASPYLLLRSGIGRDLPVGKGMSFNMGSYLTGEFDRKVRSHAGLQISHYALPATASRGFVIETWWNPPVSQAVNMPGWFEEHSENMRAYDRMMAVGVIVGTERTASVREALTGGPDVVYTPSESDLRKLGDGLKEVGKVLFTMDGIQRVMPNTWGHEVFRSADALARIDEIVQNPQYVTLGTGHPQGGNTLSARKGLGVVGPDFRVHGMENLYVCDASVFPTSVGVNPQVTVMGLAHYAAQTIV